MSASRNAGISVARGDLIAFIDADEVWLPDKLRDQVSIFDAHPQVGLAASATLYWDSWQGGEDRTVLVVAKDGLTSRIVFVQNFCFLVWSWHFF